MTELHGGDVSHWQAGLNLASTGWDFAIMKATDGTNFVDDHCDAFVNQAKNAGMKYGVYHFYEGGGAAEADYFVKHVSGYVGHALLALDFETHTSDVAGAKAFLDRVKSKTGVKPVIYFNRSVLTANDWSAVEKADYGLWYARYQSTLDSTSPWAAPALWQHTSSGHASGYSGNLDLDTFFGDEAAWDAYAKGSGQTPAPAPTPTRTIRVDGYWGGDTTSLLQHVLGTHEDGVLSAQVKGSWNAAVESAQWVDAAHAAGSDVLRAAQKKLHSWGHYSDAIDGLLGPNTIKGFQAHYGTARDGVISAPSDMVTAMQKHLNTGTF